MSHPTLIKIHTDGSRRTVRFSTEHINDASTARRITTQVTDLLEERYGDLNVPTFDNPVSADRADLELTVDFSDIGRLTSIALNELINMNRQARTRGVQLVLANVSDSLRDIFTLTRLERMFNFSTEIIPPDANDLQGQPQIGS